MACCRLCAVGDGVPGIRHALEGIVISTNPGVRSATFKAWIPRMPSGHPFLHFWSATRRIEPRLATQLHLASQDKKSLVEHFKSL
jgi:hypothetical protein